MKKNFIGAMAVIIAIAASSFTIISTKAAGDEFGDNGDESSPTQYNKLTNSYNNALCDNEASTSCAYRITSAGASHVTGNSYSASQMATFLANGWVEQIGTENGVYNGN